MLLGYLEDSMFAVLTFSKIRGVSSVLISFHIIEELSYLVSNGTQKFLNIQRAFASFILNI